MSEETHPGEAQTFVGTPDYMEKARELADSYPQLLARKQELKRQIDESHAWFYTRDEVIYKLSQGAHEQGERVKTSGTSNPVERTVLNCDKVLASMNREIQKRREEELKTSIAADAQAEANRKIAESLSDTLIEYQKIQKWDGKLPTVSGSNALVSIDPAE